MALERLKLTLKVCNFVNSAQETRVFSYRYFFKTLLASTAAILIRWRYLLTLVLVREKILKCSLGYLFPKAKAEKRRSLNQYPQLLPESEDDSSSRDYMPEHEAESAQVSYSDLPHTPRNKYKIYEWSSVTETLELLFILFTRTCT